MQYMTDSLLTNITYGHFSKVHFRLYKVMLWYLQQCTCASYCNKYSSDKPSKDKVEEIEKDGAGENYSEQIHYRQNCKTPGYIIYTVSHSYTFAMYKFIHTRSVTEDFLAT